LLHLFRMAHCRIHTSRELIFPRMYRKQGNRFRS
jgi:hypothetical protein